jgi:ribonuclease P protein component
MKRTYQPSKLVRKRRHGFRAQDGHEGRPQGHRGPPRPRPQAPVGLIGPEPAAMRGRRAGAIGRLTKRPDFLAAASGRRFHTERMSVQGRLRGDGIGDGQGLRVGLTVTKKVGHATERNRIKRRLRAAIREAAPGHEARTWMWSSSGGRDILAADYRILIEDLRRALRTVTKPKTPAPRPPPSSATGGPRRGSAHA